MKDIKTIGPYRLTTILNKDAWGMTYTAVSKEGVGGYYFREIVPHVSRISRNRDRHHEEADHGGAPSSVDFMQLADKLCEYAEITRVDRSSQIDQYKYVVYFFREAYTLNRILKRRAGWMWKEAEIIALAKGLLSLLSRLHAVGIYHGNISSHNILINNKDEFAFIDFVPLFVRKDRDTVHPSEYIQRDLAALASCVQELMQIEPVGTPSVDKRYSQEFRDSVKKAMLPPSEGHWESSHDWLTYLDGIESVEDVKIYKGEHVEDFCAWKFFLKYFFYGAVSLHFFLIKVKDIEDGLLDRTIWVNLFSKVEDVFKKKQPSDPNPQVHKEKERTYNQIRKIPQQPKFQRRPVPEKRSFSIPDPDEEMDELLDIPSTDKTSHD